MRARAKIVETKRRYEQTITMDEIRKRFNIPADATVTATLDQDMDLVGDPAVTGLRVVYERVK